MRLFLDQFIFSLFFWIYAYSLSSMYLCYIVCSFCLCHIVYFVKIWYRFVKISVTLSRYPLLCQDISVICQAYWPSDRIYPLHCQESGLSATHIMSRYCLCYIVLKEHIYPRHVGIVTACCVGGWVVCAGGICLCIPRICIARIIKCISLPLSFITANSAPRKWKT